MMAKPMKSLELHYPMIQLLIMWNMRLFKVWSEDKLNKKSIVAENFAELVSTIALTCLKGGGFDPV